MLRFFFFFFFLLLLPFTSSFNFEWLFLPSALRSRNSSLIQFRCINRSSLLRFHALVASELNFEQDLNPLLDPVSFSEIDGIVVLGGSFALRNRIHGVDNIAASGSAPCRAWREASAASCCYLPSSPGACRCRHRNLHRRWATAPSLPSFFDYFFFFIWFWNLSSLRL